MHLYLSIFLLVPGLLPLALAIPDLPLDTQLTNTLSLQWLYNKSASPSCIRSDLCPLRPCVDALLLSSTDTRLSGKVALALS